MWILEWTSLEVACPPHESAAVVTIHDEPGLGIDVNEAMAKKPSYTRRLRPTIRRRDDTP